MSGYSTITVDFDAFQVFTGPGISPEIANKTCNLEFQLALPAGWQFGVSKTTWRNSVILDPGVMHGRSATVFFSESFDAATTFLAELEGGREQKKGDNFFEEDAARRRMMMPS